MVKTVDTGYIGRSFKPANICVLDIAHILSAITTKLVQDGLKGG